MAIFVENNHALLYENKILDHLFISFLCVLLCVICIYIHGEEGRRGGKINKDDFFDFTTVRNSQLIIDYGMKVQPFFICMMNIPWN